MFFSGDFFFLFDNIWVINEYSWTCNKDLNQWIDAQTASSFKVHLVKDNDMAVSSTRCSEGFNLAT